MQYLPIKLLRPNAALPANATTGSAGYDIAACLDSDVIIKPGETKPIGSGFSVSLEPGYAAFIYARSGLGVKHGIIPANCVGVIDPDYTGEIIIGLRNTSDIPFLVKDGDRIAQMVITKYESPQPMIVKDLPETGRGAGGFGSTGV